MFGDARIRLLNQDDSILVFHLENGILPTNGLLVQNHVACSHSDLSSEFSKFWTPYWLRDGYDAQFTDDNISSFLDELTSIELPNFPAIDINIRDVNLWEKAIHDLKPFKAHGPCAWRHEELKCWPRSAIQSLANIFADCLPYKFSKHLMWARTVLLPKNESPSSMSQIRPITIISCFFRLFWQSSLSCSCKRLVSHSPVARYGWAS